MPLNHCDTCGCVIPRSKERCLACGPTPQQIRRQADRRAEQREQTQRAAERRAELVRRQRETAEKERRARDEEERQARERQDEEQRQARELLEEEERQARELREEELEIIARAKAIQAERRHQAELSWAKRFLEEEEAGPRPGRAAIPKAVRHSVWQRDGGVCVECGSKEALEYDHLIPIAMGGANTERNLQLLCESCNRRKGKSLG